MQNTVILQPLDILSLNVIPFKLADAQGEGKIIIPTDLTFRYKNGTKVYKYSNDAKLNLYCGNVRLQDTQNSVALLGIPGDVFSFAMQLTTYYNGTLLQSCDNQPLFIKNDGAALTEGDGLLYIGVDFFTIDNFSQDKE